jgi:hypothetical protein
MVKHSQYPPARAGFLAGAAKAYLELWSILTLRSETETHRSWKRERLTLEGRVSGADPMTAPGAERSKVSRRSGPESGRYE